MINRFTSQPSTLVERGSRPGFGIEPHIFRFPSNQEQVQDELLRPVMDQGEVVDESRSGTVTPSNSYVGIALASPSANQAGSFETADVESENKTPAQYQKIRAGRHPTSADYPPRRSADLRNQEREGDVFLRSNQEASSDSTTPSRRKPRPEPASQQQPALVAMSAVPALGTRQLKARRSSELLPPVDLVKRGGDFPRNPDSLPVPPRKRSHPSLAQKAGLVITTTNHSQERSDQDSSLPFQTPTLPFSNEDSFGTAAPSKPSPLASRHFLREGSSPPVRYPSDSSALSVPAEEPRPDSGTIPLDAGSPSPVEKRSPSEEEGSFDQETGIRRSQSRSRKFLGHSAASSISSATQAGSVAPREPWNLDGEDGRRFEGLWFRTPHSPATEEMSDEGRALRRRRDSDVVARLIQQTPTPLSATRVNSAYDPSINDLEGGSHSQGPSNEGSQGSDSWKMGRVAEQQATRFEGRQRLQSHGSFTAEVMSSSSPPEPTTSSSPFEALPPHFASGAASSSHAHSTPAATHGHGVDKSSLSQHQHKTSVSTNASFIDMGEEETMDNSGDSKIDPLRDYQDYQSQLLSRSEAPHSRASAADYFLSEGEEQDSQASTGQWPDASKTIHPEWI